jgi:adenylylsulfate kinase-like enzyme
VCIGSPCSGVEEPGTQAAGHLFVEVYVNAPLATVIERDVKGLYRHALAGEILNVAGISDPYEPPVAPAIEVRTDIETPAESEAKIVAKLAELNILQGLKIGSEGA